MHHLRACILYVQPFPRLRNHRAVLSMYLVADPHNANSSSLSISLSLSVLNLPLFDNGGRWSNVTRKEESHREVFLCHILHNGFLFARILPIIHITIILLYPPSLILRHLNWK
jgi:hypothetical protein